MLKKFFRRDTINIICIFLVWRVILVVFSVVAAKFIPLASLDKFLGGGKNFFSAPLLYSWANFDGEHYLSISIYGYRALEQAFFPVYPKLISVFNILFSGNLFGGVISGIIISNIAFLGALLMIFRLISIDYTRKISYLTIIVLLIFPTSFYFGALYSESLFLLLSVTTFYFARKNMWLYAGVLGAIASATRVFGILLLPSLLIDAWQRKQNLSSYIYIGVISLGLVGYMLYLGLTVGNPLAFYSLQTNVGEQHQTGIVLLPQVLYRYTNMLLHTDISNPIYSTLFLEFFSGIIFFFLPIIGVFKKVRTPYLFYTFFGFLIPTVQGSFSSSPRYVLTLFPSFLIIALLLVDFPKWVKAIYFLISIGWLFFETSLFLRGYWVA